ncbi:MAG: hypothetical protein JW955_02185 [Sedimentisphaerales bacterium]|nr:hypothetical protein [Sedimentisphaerales bacterium]
MEKRKRSRRRRLLIWLAVDLAVAAVVVGLLVYRPSRYRPVAPAPNPDGETVHPYLHRDLGSTFYNEAQRQRPFDLVVLDEKLNEAIAGKRWQSEGVTLAAPQVFFAPGRIVLMGTANVEGAGFVVTIELAPRLDERGYLDLPVEKVKVGAMNVTPLAKMMSRKMYQEQVNTGAIDVEDLGTKIVASLLNGQPFEPVLEVDDKSVRLKDFDIAQGRLTAHFVPVKGPK